MEVLASGRHGIGHWSVDWDNSVFSGQKNNEEWTAVYGSKDCLNSQENAKN